jgi:hypothetical protein
LQGFKTEAKPEVETTQYPAEKDKQTAVPAVDLQPAQGQTEKEPLQTPQTKCPEGHDLIPFESEEDDFLCSVCECEFPLGTILYGCRACDYDLCRECLAHTVFHSSGKSFVAAFPEMQTFQSFGGSNKSLLQGLVLDDRIYLDLFGSIRSAFNLRFSPLQPLVHSIWHHLASFEFMWHWELMPKPWAESRPWQVLVKIFERPQNQKTTPSLRSSSLQRRPWVALRRSYSEQIQTISGKPGKPYSECPDNS